MKRFLILVFLAFFANNLLAQSKFEVSEAVNTCFGAANIFDSGDYKLQFTGKKGDNFISGYPSLKEISSDNQLWCSFIAPSDGKLNFDATVSDGFVQMVVFIQDENEICADIANGAAEIKRLYIGKDQTTVGLNKEIGGGTLYTLDVTGGNKINVLFTTEAKKQSLLDLHWTFDGAMPIDRFETKVVDHRDDDFAPTFTIKVRDKKTQQPLVANLSIEGLSSLEALYIGSDFYFNVERNCKLTIKCDVEGYFFDDRVETVTSVEDQEVIIELETITTGKSIAIEEIEFMPGTSEFTRSSEPKLNRLKDFLALNANLHVEIQGHVFALGKNSFAGQKISEARAKRVLKYLVDNGIDKSRLEAVGYGNTKPIYELPRFSYEEQANRRVEILIL